MPETRSWKQERPSWCPHSDCIFKRRTMDAICGGELPVPEPHGPSMNTHRFCINQKQEEIPTVGIFDLQVNDTDLEAFRYIFDALDGKVTSWLSRR